MKSARESDVPSSVSPSSGTRTRAALPDMRLGDATTVLAVERLGSMARAARELGVTPSQVSKTISRLQSWSGGALFVRKGSELAPTPLGLRFLDRMRLIVEDDQGIDWSIDKLPRVASKRHDQVLWYKNSPDFADSVVELGTKTIEGQRRTLVFFNASLFLVTDAGFAEQCKQENVRACETAWQRVDNGADPFDAR